MTGHSRDSQDRVSNDRAAAARGLPALRVSGRRACVTGAVSALAVLIGDWVAIATKAIGCAEFGENDPYRVERCSGEFEWYRSTAPEESWQFIILAAFSLLKPESAIAP